jgi:hypothetical protein
LLSGPSLLGPATETRLDPAGCLAHGVGGLLQGTRDLVEAPDRGGIDS